MSLLRIGAYDALAYRSDEFWLFDVRPMNFVEDHKGDLFPIDIITQRIGQ
jgi:hypothetical protein